MTDYFKGRFAELADRSTLTLYWLGHFDLELINKPENPKCKIVRAFADLAFKMVDLIPDGMDLTITLSSLLDARDAAIRVKMQPVDWDRLYPAT